jgi:hypothetical protein
MGFRAYWRSAVSGVPWQPPMRLPRSNLDMLAWFSDEERHACGSCGEKACVTLPKALASFCLACGAVTLNGERIDADGRLPA